MAACEQPSKRVVLLPIDASEHSQRALEWYLHSMRQPGDKVILAHVYVPPPFPSMSLYHAHAQDEVHGEYRVEVESSLKHAQKLISEFEEKCNTHKLIDYEAQLLNTNYSVGGTLMKLVDEKGVSLIIIGSRGLSRARRTILGSVSEYIVHHSRVPVTVVPPAEAVNPF